MNTRSEKTDHCENVKAQCLNNITDTSHIFLTTFSTIAGDSQCFGCKYSETLDNGNNSTTKQFSGFLCDRNENSIHQDVLLNNEQNSEIKDDISDNTLPPTDHRQKWNEASNAALQKSARLLSNEGRVNLNGIQHFEDPWFLSALDVIWKETTEQSKSHCEEMHIMNKLSHLYNTILASLEQISRSDKVLVLKKIKRIIYQLNAHHQKEKIYLLEKVKRGDTLATQERLVTRKCIQNLTIRCNALQHLVKNYRLLQKVVTGIDKTGSFTNVASEDSSQTVTEACSSLVSESPLSNLTSIMKNSELLSDLHILRESSQIKPHTESSCWETDTNLKNQNTSYTQEKNQQNNSDTEDHSQKSFSILHSYAHYSDVEPQENSFKRENRQNNKYIKNNSKPLHIVLDLHNSSSDMDGLAVSDINKYSYFCQTKDSQFFGESKNQTRSSFSNLLNELNGHKANDIQKINYHNDKYVNYGRTVRIQEGNHTTTESSTDTMVSLNLAILPEISLCPDDFEVTDKIGEIQSATQDTSKVILGQKCDGLLEVTPNSQLNSIVLKDGGSSLKQEESTYQSKHLTESNLTTMTEQHKTTIQDHLENHNASNSLYANQSVDKTVHTVCIALDNSTNQSLSQTVHAAFTALDTSANQSLCQNIHTPCTASDKSTNQSLCQTVHTAQIIPDNSTNTFLCQTTHTPCTESDNSTNQSLCQTVPTPYAVSDKSKHLVSSLSKVSSKSDLSHLLKTDLFKAKITKIDGIKTIHDTDTNALPHSICDQVPLKSTTFAFLTNESISPYSAPDHFQTATSVHQPTVPSDPSQTGSKFLRAGMKTISPTNAHFLTKRKRGLQEQNQYTKTSSEKRKVQNIGVSAQPPTFQDLFKAGIIIAGHRLLRLLWKGCEKQASVTDTGHVLDETEHIFSTPLTWFRAITGMSKAKHSQAYSLIEYRGQTLASLFLDNTSGRNVKLKQNYKWISSKNRTKDPVYSLQQHYSFPNKITIPLVDEDKICPNDEDDQSPTFDSNTRQNPLESNKNTPSPIPKSRSFQSSSMLSEKSSFNSKSIQNEVINSLPLCSPKVSQNCVDFHNSIMGICYLQLIVDNEIISHTNSCQLSVFWADDFINTNISLQTWASVDTWK